ncbi:MAG: hypothetical protein WCH65_02085 [bacterium]
MDKLNSDIREATPIQDSIAASANNSNKNLVQNLQINKQRKEEYEQKVKSLKERAQELYFANKVLERV